jgi:F-type H+-transporting ATPase subunit b
MKKRAAVNELKDQVSSIALDIATKVLQNELESKDKQMQLVSKLLQDSDMN